MRSGFQDVTSSDTFRRRAENGTPMCAALQQARGVVESWLAEHPRCFPPVMLHITDGESTDGDPTQYGQALGDLKSSDGNALLFNCHLSSKRSPKIEYPTGPSALPDDSARTLFAMSSNLPQKFHATGASIGLSL